MTDMGGKIRTLRHALWAVLLIFTLSSTTEANPLDIELEPYPVILAGFLNASYTVSNGSLVITGKTKTLDKGTGQVTYSNPFQLTATIAGGTATAAQLMIGTGGALLSTSNLMQFGYDAVAGGALEFLFDTPTGSLVTDGTFPNKPVDVIFRGLLFPGSWNANWTSTNFAAMAEIKDPDPPQGVPEPSTLLLMLTGAGALARRYRRRPADV